MQNNVMRTKQNTHADEGNFTSVYKRMFRTYGLENAQVIKKRDS